jgi:hypothetical protein
MIANKIEHFISIPRGCEGYCAAALFGSILHCDSNGPKANKTGIPGIIDYNIKRLRPPAAAISCVLGRFMPNV